jgi:uncharacterized protein with WD repeat
MPIINIKKQIENAMNNDKSIKNYVKVNISNKQLAIGYTYQKTNDIILNGVSFKICEDMTIRPIKDSVLVYEITSELFSDLPIWVSQNELDKIVVYIGEYKKYGRGIIDFYPQVYIKNPKIICSI